MSKLNRIGNKLGLAGALGILLAVGMVANQMVTESTVTAVERPRRPVPADRRKHVGGASQHEAGPARGPRDQVGQNSPPKFKRVRRNCTTSRRSKPRELDIGADATAQKPETRERLQRIKDADAGLRAQARRNSRRRRAMLLAQIDKRSAISTEWSKAFAAELASPALAQLDKSPRHRKAAVSGRLQRERACALQSGATASPAIADDRREGSPRPRERSRPVPEVDARTRWTTSEFRWPGSDALESNHQEIPRRQWRGREDRGLEDRYPRPTVR